MNRTEITRIKGLSEIRRLPRLGKIRLGIKVRSQRTGREYPKEVAWFVCPSDVQRVYGEKPTSLDIMFPIEDESKCFPQAYKAYVTNGLRCKGDGERALRRQADIVWKDNEGKVLDDATPRILKNGGSDSNSLVEIGCPCPLLDGGQCNQGANLMVLLPKVSMGGIFQIDTGSFYNIVRINSSIDYVRALLGRVALVPLVLTRQQEEIEYEGKKAKHYLLQCTLNANLEEVAKLRENVRMILTQVERLALPAPVEDGPEPTGPVPIEEEEADSPAGESSGGTQRQPDVSVGGESPTPPAGEPSPLEQAWAQARELMEAKGWTEAKLTVWCRKTHGCGAKELDLLRVQGLVGHLQQQGEATRTLV